MPSPKSIVLLRSGGEVGVRRLGPIKFRSTTLARKTFKLLKRRCNLLSVSTTLGSDSGSRETGDPESEPFSGVTQQGFLAGFPLNRLLAPRITPAQTSAVEAKRAL